MPRTVERSGGALDSPARDADPDLPRLPPARHRLERLQRPAGGGARPRRRHEVAPPLPGPPPRTSCRSSTPSATGTTARRGSRSCASPSGVTAWRPDIGGLLPVYVADRYEGVEAQTFLDCTDAEIARYVDANVAAVRDVAARVAARRRARQPPRDGAGRSSPAALGDDVPYAVKIHGSALEYTVKRDPERFLPVRPRGPRARAHGPRRLAPHRREPVGGDGRRRAARPARASGRPASTSREFRPRPRAEARGRGAGAAPTAPGGGRRPSRSGPRLRARRRRRSAARWRRSTSRAGATATSRSSASSSSPRASTCSPRRGRSCSRDVPHARLVVVGFGGYRDGLERLLAALGRGRPRRGRARSREAGRALEGGPRAPLRHLLAFLDDLDGRPGRARRLPRGRARRSRERVVLTGRLEHEELAPLLAACEAQVVPSTFPEAFGMVAAEAAACGALPVVGRALGPGRGDARPLAAAVPGAGAAVAVVPGRRRRGPRPRRADRRVAAGARRRARRDPRRARRRRPRALLVGRRGAPASIAAAEGRHDALPEPV